MITEKLTVDELAQRLRVKKATVWAWVRANKIPFERTVRRILFDAQEIEAFLRRDRPVIDERSSGAARPSA